MIKKSPNRIILIVICVCIVAGVWHQQYVEYNKLKGSIQSAYIIISQYYDELESAGNDYGSWPELFNPKYLRHFRMASDDILTKYNFEYNPDSYLAALGRYGYISHDANDEECIQNYIEIVSYISNQMATLNAYMDRMTKVFIPILDNSKLKDEILKTYKNIFNKLVDSIP